MTTFEHVLHGCAPVPLAGYLKALGVFRLVAEQADREACGSWRDERFVLRTRLSEEALVGFFVEEYEPSPIISPWNGRAGFLEGEDDDSDQKSSRLGAELVRCYAAAGPRFAKMRNAVEVYRSVRVIGELDRARAEEKILKKKNKRTLSAAGEQCLKERLNELASLIKKRKTSVIEELRSEAPDWAVDWFDVCQRIGAKDAKMPLLGSGGNDGSRDFGMNFGDALKELFDFTSGRPLPRTEDFIRESLGFDIMLGMAIGNLGQYQPSGAGENITTGFQSEQPLFNPADLVFLLEGSVLFAGVTTRRLGSTETRLSFPFTVSALTAGSGAVASADDTNFAEFWAHLWARETRLKELRAFLAEGRTCVNGRTARDGLEFAISVCTLGSERGVPEYQRFALLQREPRNPRKATPIGRVRVRENPRASLISELDARGWLSRARAVVNGSKVAPSLGTVGRNLDQALFRLAGTGAAEAVQDALIAMGALVRELGRRPAQRANKGGVPPPPRLSRTWRVEADDGSHEFALAEALASLEAMGDESEQSLLQLPFRRHLVPLSIGHWKDDWDDTTEARSLALWTGRDLLRDMAAVLERRLIEAQRHAFVDHQGNPELPISGRRAAPLAAVTAFLANRTNDDRIRGLAAGLAWSQPRAGAPSASAREDAIPFAYAALKPLFAPGGITLGEVQPKHVNPLILVRLIRAGRAEDAVRLAQRLARGAGLPAPFATLAASPPADPLRLAAALLLPITKDANNRLLNRAYCELHEDKQDSHAA